MSFVLVTCEHGESKVPAAYRALLRGQEPVLAGPEGHDLGALALARRLREGLAATFKPPPASRLLVDLDCDRDDRAVFSKVSRRWKADLKQRLLSEIYDPYRGAIDALVGAAVRRQGRVVHLAVHSFAPEPESADLDVGVIYDAGRVFEKYFANRWKAELRARAPRLQVRFNRPGRGRRPEGLTAALRRRHAEGVYLGIEIQVSQRHVLGRDAAWKRLQEDIAGSLRSIIASSYS